MKKKLAIISSYHEMCGIANYTEHLEPAFREYYDVDVLKLETEVLRSVNAELVKLGDSFIEQMAERLAQYDFINIQFEASLYGSNPELARRRLFKLLRACKNCILTFHSVNFATPTFPWRQLLTRHVVSSLKQYFSAKRWPMFYDSLIKEIKRLNSKKDRQFSIVVHDGKTQRFISRVYHFENVYAHPLAMSTAAERATSPTIEEKTHFYRAYGLSEDEKIIGVFGFVSEYKGHLVALQTLRHLPENYTMMIFGAQHPASVQAYVPVEPYLDRLLKFIDDCDAADKKNVKNRDKEETNQTTHRSFSKRVRFIGDTDDASFARAMRCCDFVVLPYMEVNQMGSAVAALAIENHARAIFSNTKCFFELSQFFPDCFASFDIGNYLQLANIIEHYQDKYGEKINDALKKHNLENNVKQYVDIFGRINEPD